MTQVHHGQEEAEGQGRQASKRIVLRTGEALVEAEPAWSAAEPEVVIGELDGPVGYAIANLIGNQAKGHTKVFAILNSDVQIRPATLMVSKVTVKSSKYTNILMGTVQAAIAHGVLDAVRAGDIPKRKVNDLGIIVSVWLDPSILEAENVDFNMLFQTQPRSDRQGDPQGDAPRADDRLAAGEPGPGAALFPPTGAGRETGVAASGVDRLQPAGAVAERGNAGADAVEHREEEVVERRLRRQDDVAAGLDRAAAAAGEDDRQVVVPVAVAVGEAAAVHDHAVVEQRAGCLRASPSGS